MTEKVGFTIKELEELEESLSINTGNDRRRQALSLLLSAFNDWPTPILTTDKYAEEVAVLVGGVANFENVSYLLNRMSPSMDSWRCESLSQISELFILYPHATSLQELISVLGQRTEY